MKKIFSISLIISISILIYVILLSTYIAPEINLSIKTNYFTTRPWVDINIYATMEKISCFGFGTEKYNITFFLNGTGYYVSHPLNFTLNNYEDTIVITYRKESSGGSGSGRVTLTYEMLEYYNGKTYLLELGKPP
jgi:hypothetical protein